MWIRLGLKIIFVWIRPSRMFQSPFYLTFTLDIDFFHRRYIYIELVKLMQFKLSCCLHMHIFSTNFVLWSVRPSQWHCPNKSFSVTISEFLWKCQDTLSEVASVDYICKALVAVCRVLKSFYYKNIIILPKTASRLLVRCSVITRLLLCLIYQPFPVFF